MGTSSLPGRRLSQRPRICGYYREALMSGQQHELWGDFLYIRAPFSLPLFKFEYFYPIILWASSLLNSYSIHATYTGCSNGSKAV